MCEICRLPVKHVMQILELDGYVHMACTAYGTTLGPSVQVSFGCDDICLMIPLLLLDPLLLQHAACVPCVYAMCVVVSVGRTNSHVVQREQLERQLTECVGPDAAHLVLQLLQWSLAQRLSAADALALPYCAKTLSEQQSAVHSNAAESVSSHAGHAASHVASHADGVQPTEADQEESGQGRAPWWGAPLCR